MTIIEILSDYICKYYVSSMMFLILFIVIFLLTHSLCVFDCRLVSDDGAEYSAPYPTRAAVQAGRVQQGYPPR